jgi:hypothetical protein
MIADLNPGESIRIAGENLRARAPTPIAASLCPDPLTSLEARPRARPAPARLESMK